jgi:hypothetical protein
MHRSVPFFCDPWPGSMLLYFVLGVSLAGRLYLTICMMVPELALFSSLLVGMLYDVDPKWWICFWFQIYVVWYDESFRICDGMW